MKFYFMHFVPNIKTKFCHFLGAASVRDFDRLIKKLSHLEHKMERMDANLRRIQRRQMLREVHEEQPAKNAPKKVKTSSSTKRPAPTAKAKPRKKETVTVPSQIPSKVTRLKTAKPETKDAAVAAKPSSPAVMVLGTDTEVRGAVSDYFGKETPLIEIHNFNDIPVSAGTKDVAAVFFDRAWLAQPKARQALLSLKERLAGRPMVGISSYLTLSVARSAAEQDPFATYLTKPLNADALAVALADKKPEQAIS